MLVQLQLQSKVLASHISFTMFIVSAKEGVVKLQNTLPFVSIMSWEGTGAEKCYPGNLRRCLQYVAEWVFCIFCAL